MSKPDGKRALFSARPAPPADAEGKHALYSGHRPAGPIQVDCSLCGATTRISPSDALRRLVGFSLWIPGRTYSRRLRCPACHRRAWVRLRLR